MFKYTKAGLNIIIDDIKKLAKIFKYGSLIFSIIYYIVAICLKIGILVVNIIFLLLLISYTIFDLIIDKKKKENKLIIRKISRSYTTIKIILRGFTLLVTLYGMYLGTSNTSPISIILATLMIILWILEVLFEVIARYVTNKKDLIVTAFKKDIDPILKVTNIFKKGENKTERIKEDNELLIILENRIKLDEEKQNEKEVA